MTVHFDFSSDNGWLCCALLFFLCWYPLLTLTPLHIQTQMCATGAHVWYHSRNKGPHCGIWGQGHVFDGKLYLTCDIFKDEPILKQLKVPIKSKSAKSAAKRAWKAGCTVRFCLTFQSSACP